MKRMLAREAFIKFAAGVLMVMALLFLPAGTFRYPNAWLFLALLFIPMLLAGVFMLIFAPDLLRRRLNAKETEPGQRSFIGISGGMFVAGFIVCALDFRFSWLPLPPWVSCAAGAVLLAGYLMFAEVLRENQYVSRTIEVAKEQHVVDTGLYAVVRHPMYTATLLLFLATPLVLGSLIAFPIFWIWPAILVKRIHGEEAFLKQSLPGYEAYMKKVKYRLLPFLW